MWRVPPFCEDVGKHLLTLASRIAVILPRIWETIRSRTATCAFDWASASLRTRTIRRRTFVAAVTAVVGSRGGGCDIRCADKCGRNGQDQDHLFHVCDFSLNRERFVYAARVAYNSYEYTQRAVRSQGLFCRLFS